MESGPIFRAMTRNKLGVILIAMQIALTLTVMVNSVSIIQERKTLLAKPSGIDEANLFYFSSIGFGEAFNEEVTAAEDLMMLRQLPGIANATITNAVPLTGSGSSSGYRTEVDQNSPNTPAAYYSVDEQALDTMNLDLIAGENFTESDIVLTFDGERQFPSKAIISLAMSEIMFPDDANMGVGKTMYFGADSSVQVVGVVSKLQAPWPESSLVENSALFPENNINGFTTYLVRAEPGQRDRLMAEVEDLLTNSNGTRIIRELNSVEETREDTLRLHSAMTTILYTVIGTLVFITSMGIVGLAVFGINRRRKQIGTRRALGASHGQILRYFMLENFFITGIGVAIGAALSIGFNVFLVSAFDIARMEWYFTPVGMVSLLLIGQLAVFGPSMGASKVSPAVATRTV